MCILFVCLNNHAEEGEYQLILSNNRDEYFTRPTKPAACWESDPSCIGGIDLQHGREGGTWFGVSTEGKVASLLNILLPHDPPHDKLGRGHIVTNYLKKPITASDYVQHLKMEGDKYNLFNLVLIEKDTDGKWGIFYYTNTGPVIEKHFIEDGIYGFSNSVIDIPFKKVTYGESQFAAVIREYKEKQNREALTNDLIGVMSDKTSNWPDPQIRKQGSPRLDELALSQRGSINVRSPQLNYGTRTNSLFMSEQGGACEYIERTMREPIDFAAPIWDTTSHTFAINSSNTDVAVKTTTNGNQNGH